MNVPLELHNLLQVKEVQSNMVMRFIFFNFLILDICNMQQHSMLVRAKRTCKSKNLIAA